MTIAETKHLEVHILGNEVRVEIAETEDQMMEAKVLDDLIFSAHLGITVEELVEIMNHGRLLLLRDSEGKLIGESQVITSPISQHPHLDPDEAYNYGTAIAPERQNGGVAQILFKAQEMVALEAGKTRSTLTVRLENAPSIRSRFKAGFEVVGYDPKKYGSVEEDGARLIMEKNLVNPAKNPSNEALRVEIAAGKIPLATDENISQILINGTPLVGILVKNGDEVDFSAHKLVKKAFKNGNYKGIGLLRANGFAPSVDENTGLLVLKHKDFEL
ncbi:GNAT family N-acetyltransferase [Candidatus Woesebacteria bacterium]|nr:GNAT family N-acetyltransferase [Candidatus Woesebacteria bacterium]